ncbi:MAG TPA: hypothetical protein VF138_09410 [Caulobacteraceae bacterium]
MAERARPIRRLALVWALGVALGLAILLQGASAMGFWRPDPAIQTERAAGLLLWAQTPVDAEPAVALARQALQRAPLLTRAADVIAGAYFLDGKTGQAAALYSAAAAANHRDAAASTWLFQRALSAGRYDEAFTLADATLRRDADAARPLMGSLYTTAAAEPAALQALAKRLALSPPWRPLFFDDLFAGRGSPAIIYPLFDAMRASGSPPTTHEVQGYVTLLTRAGRYEQAYIAWLLSLGPAGVQRLRYIYDGGFEEAPTIDPFGWTLGGGAGGGAAIEDAPGGGHGLLVSWDGYAASTFARQQLLLPPGRYRFAGRMLAPDNAAVGGLKWTLTCLPSAKVLDMTVTGTGGDWRKFSQSFEVPAGCETQRLTLASAGGERRTTLAIWFDDLAVEPGGAEGGRVQP